MSVIALVGLIVSVLSVFSAMSIWWWTRKDRSKAAETKVITEHVSAMLTPLSNRLIVLEQRSGPDSKERDRLVMKGMITEALEPIVNIQTTMSVKVETLWSNLATMMAQVLHQPDPARRSVDRLLEAFMSGTLTHEERIELRKCLVAIRDWEPGSGDAVVQLAPGNTATFPVHNGEQAPAAILLLTMDEPQPSVAQGGVFRK